MNQPVYISTSFCVWGRVLFAIIHPTILKLISEKRLDFFRGSKFHLQVDHKSAWPPFPIEGEFNLAPPLFFGPKRWPAQSLPKHSQKRPLLAFLCAFKVETSQHNLTFLFTGGLSFASSYFASRFFPQQNLMPSQSSEMRLWRPVSSLEISRSQKAATFKAQKKGLKRIENLGRNIGEAKFDTPLDSRAKLYWLVSGLEMHKNQQWRLSRRIE